MKVLFRQRRRILTGLAGLVLWSALLCCCPAGMAITDTVGIHGAVTIGGSCHATKDQGPDRHTCSCTARQWLRVAEGPLKVVDVSWQETRSLSFLRDAATVVTPYVRPASLVRSYQRSEDFSSEPPLYLQTSVLRV